MPGRSRTRCAWAPPGKPLYLAYHDEQWGVPVHDDRMLFEMLVLEGAQAGLSWETILNKRAAYRRAFDRFDPRKVAAYDARRIATLLADPGIVRNRLKVVLAVSADEVAERVTDAIGANAIVGADELTVTVRDEVVTLAGTVRSREDHKVALAAAAATPGVSGVRDDMRVVG